MVQLESLPSEWRSRKRTQESEEMKKLSKAAAAEKSKKISDAMRKYWRKRKAKERKAA